MRPAALALMLSFLPIGGFSAEIEIKTYKSAPLEANMKDRERERIYRQFAELPGTIIHGPRKPFTVRRILFDSGWSLMVATDLSGQSPNGLGRAIVEQTSCEIPNNSRIIQFNVTLVKYGASFSCSPS
ncbi:MAG: hypothetical protein AAF922_01205 [Pseudomonadota bacterium]